MKFERIIPTQKQIEELFFLLKSRKYSISHKEIPSKKDHFDFVSKNPYLAWYLIYKDSSLIGSVYLHVDNSIGINLTEYFENDISSIIKYIKDNHKPLPSIKSVRSSKFFINVPPENKYLIETLKKLDKNVIQHSFHV